jgi:hypothetical protein
MQRTFNDQCDESVACATLNAQLTKQKPRFLSRDSPRAKWPDDTTGKDCSVSDLGWVAACCERAAALWLGAWQDRSESSTQRGIVQRHRQAMPVRDASNQFVLGAEDRPHDRARNWG